ncbi:MAG: M48 family metalloprotease [Desulfobacter sp.]|nr:MAG: M48 family metalloprotease [Desulfobacter sp.]
MDRRPDKKHDFRHTLFHSLQTTTLLIANAGLLGVLGWFMAGPAGIKIAMIAVVLVFVFTPHVPAHIIMGHLRARPLTPEQAPRLYAMLNLLSQKAGLARMPALYYLPSPRLNAFAVDQGGDIAVAVTKGLVTALTPREMAGILAHEITHIKNNDFQVMALSSVFGRLTGYLSLAGQFLLVISLPLFLTGYARVSLLPLVLMVFAPMLSMLLYLALSRTREFEADLGSARLLDDPGALASALARVEQFNTMSAGYRLLPLPARPGEPPLLRSHPPTQERIRRLQHLARQSAPHGTHGTGRRITVY